MHVYRSEFDVALHAIGKVLQLAQQLPNSSARWPLVERHEPRLTQQTKAAGDARDWSVVFHLWKSGVVLFSSVRVDIVHLDMTSTDLGNTPHNDNFSIPES